MLPRGNRKGVLQAAALVPKDGSEVAGPHKVADNLAVPAKVSLIHQSLGVQHLHPVKLAVKERRHWLDSPKDDQIGGVCPAAQLGAVLARPKGPHAKHSVSVRIEVRVHEKQVEHLAGLALDVVRGASDKGASLSGVQMGDSVVGKHEN